MKKRVVILFFVHDDGIIHGGHVVQTVIKKQVQQGTQETASEVFDGPHSAQMKLDLSKLVTKLADYKGIDVTISGNYDVTDDQVEQNLMSLLSYYGITGVEVKDRDTVQKNDYVKVDYTGYLDGDAFDGGSATDTMIDVANNCDATQKTNYIDGFSDGLVGAKVGGRSKFGCDIPGELPVFGSGGKENNV